VCVCESECECTFANDIEQERVDVKVKRLMVKKQLGEVAQVLTPYLRESARARERERARASERASEREARETSQVVSPAAL
jgi:hypothetical protein